MLPTADELLDGALGFSIPLTTTFRGTKVREGLLLHGPAGWGEFAPFPEYGADESARWLSAAIEAAWIGWPAARRELVPVNAIVPAVAPDVAAAIVRDSGCTTVKIKVAEPGQSLDDDIARVAAVREALGPAGRIRIDANGAWIPEVARDALRTLSEYHLEYVEQPCASLPECTALRLVIDVPVAIDEALRKADDPHRVVGLREAADVLVLKVSPLGGVRPALAIAETYGLPCVVSSALDSSVGLAAGLALAASLPELSYACGLGSGRLMAADVAADRLLPVNGELHVLPHSPTPAAVGAVAMSTSKFSHWCQRLSDSRSALVDD
ncbi:MAG TPA: o-succinylbenzoate synthase [Actinomycetes bacterium]|nr:o-succinylbenzoate synthase [Actinomycetes bacterium]